MEICISMETELLGHIFWIYIMSNDGILDFPLEYAGNCTIDLGSCAYSNNEVKYQLFQLSNTLYDNDMVILGISLATKLPDSDFPAIVEFENVSSPNVESTSSKEKSTSIDNTIPSEGSITAIHLPSLLSSRLDKDQENGSLISSAATINMKASASDESLFPLTIMPRSSRQLSLTFVPIIPLRDYEHPRTSYFNVTTTAMVSFQLVDRATNQTSTTHTMMLTITATLCMSLLHVDEMEIDFGDCYVGDKLNRVIQVWNRSECPLEYKIALASSTPTGSRSNTLGTFDDGSMSTPVVITCGDNSRMMYPSASTSKLPTFGAEKLNISVQPRVSGHYNMKFRVENMKNSQNTKHIVCKVHVIDKVYYFIFWCQQRTYFLRVYLGRVWCRCCSNMRYSGYRFIAGLWSCIW
jgi:hypothetical protein